MKEQQLLQRPATLSDTIKDTDNSGIIPIFDFSQINPESLKDEVSQLQQEDNLSNELLSRKIDLSIDCPDIEFLFKKDGIGCIPIGDIVIVKGKQKAGKSTLIACWASALLIGDYMGFTALKNNCKVVYVDTEQNQANTRRLAKKVHALCGFPIDQNNPVFIVINLRGDNPSERINFICESIRKFHPDLLFLDGAKDLIIGGDINDPKASGDVVQLLMTLTKEYHMAIVTVLHENKKDSNLRGHIGTELLNKCSECWQVQKIGNSFKTVQTESRNEPTKGFSFMLSSDNLPIPNQFIPKITAKEKTDAKKLETLKQCFKPERSIKYTELVQLYCEYGNCKKTTAQTYIKTAIIQGYLLLEIDGKYKFNYQELESGCTPIPPTPS